MILVNALGALGGVYLWLFYDLSNPVSALITLALGALCAALLLLAVVGIAGIVRLSRGPALVIDDDGIVVRTTLSSVGFIPWEQTLATRQRYQQAVCHRALRRPPMARGAAPGDRPCDLLGEPAPGPRWPASRSQWNR